jgi:sugar/nucleoside kinase (ribokinase family)
MRGIQTETTLPPESVSGGALCAQLSVPRLREALRYANAVGALTSTRQGAIPALPTAQMVDEFLAG